MSSFLARLITFGESFEKAQPYVQFCHKQLKGNSGIDSYYKLPADALLQAVLTEHSNVSLNPTTSYFQWIRHYLLQANIASDVTEVIALRKCGNSIDIRIGFIPVPEGMVMVQNPDWSPLNTDEPDFTCVEQSPDTGKSKVRVGESVLLKVVSVDENYGIPHSDPMLVFDEQFEAINQAHYPCNCDVLLGVELRQLKSGDCLTASDNTLRLHKRIESLLSGFEISRSVKQIRCVSQQHDSTSLEVLY